MKVIYGYIKSTGELIEIGYTEHGAKVAATRAGSREVGYRSPINNMYVKIAIKVDMNWNKITSSNYNHTPFNLLPIIISNPGLYRLRNGEIASIHRVDDNDNKEVTAFTCKGQRQQMFRGKLIYRGYTVWHESGRSTGFENKYDIIAKEA